MKRLAGVQRVWVAMVLAGFAASAACADTPPDWAWIHQIRSPYDPAHLVRITTADDGSMFVAGTLDSSTFFNPGESAQRVEPVYGDTDAFLAKYSSTGQLHWINRVGSYVPYLIADYGSGLGRTPDGDLLLIGLCAGPAVATQTGGPDVPFDGGVFMARYSPDGRVKYLQTLNQGAYIRIRGTGVGPDGSFFVAGSYIHESTFLSNQPGGEIVLPDQHTAHERGFMAHYALDGRLLWVRYVDSAQDGSFGIAEGLDNGSAIVIESIYQSMDVPAIVLKHYDATGHLTWIRGVNSQYTSVAAMRRNPDGGVMILGGASGPVFGQAAPAGDNLFLARLDANGSVLWVRFVPRATADGGSGQSLDVSTGSVAHVLVHKAALAGATPGTLDAASGYLLVRYDSEGNVRFWRQLDVSGKLSPLFLARSPDASYRIAGSFTGGLRLSNDLPEFAPLGGDLLVASLTYDGIPIWMHQISNGSHGRIADGNGVAAHGDNGAVVVGTFAGCTTLGSFSNPPVVLQAEGQEDAFVVHYRADGTIQWANSLADASGWAAGLRVARAPDDTFLVLAGTGKREQSSRVRRDGFHVLRYSPEGERLADFPISDANTDYSAMTVDKHGNVWVSGYFDGLARFFSTGGQPIVLDPRQQTVHCVVHYDPSGRLVWIRQDGLGADSRALATAPTADGGSVTVGNFQNGTAVFGADGPNETHLDSGDGYHAFIASYAANGALRWAFRIGGPATSADNVAVLKDDTLLVIGSYREGVTLGTGEPRQTSFLGAGLFLARYHPDGHLLGARHISYDPYVSTPVLAQPIPTSDGGWDLAGNFLRTTWVFAPGEPEERTFANRAGYFLAHYRPDATMAWLRDGGTNYYPVGLARAMDGSYYVAGREVVARYVFPRPAPTPTPTATPTPIPTAIPTPGPKDLMAFVLDDFGAVHTGGAANAIQLTGGAYFGWNIARTMQLVFGFPATNDARVGVMVLDGYGAVHTYSCSRPYQNFYFLPDPGDVAVDLAVFQKDLGGVPGNIGLFVLDRFGRLWAAGEASTAVAMQGSITPPLDGGAHRAVALRLADVSGNSGWILDNHGDVQAFGGAVETSFPVSAQDDWVEFVKVDDRLVRMDASGNLEWSGEPIDGWELPMVDGEWMIDLEVEPGRGLVALDRFGAIYRSGDAVVPEPGQGPPYFGFEAARDLEVGPPFGAGR